MNNFKNFLTIATVIFLTGCVSNQSFYLKVDSVNDFTLLNYEDFALETNSENLSPEVNHIVLEAIESRLVSELELRGLDSSKDSNLIFDLSISAKDEIESNRFARRDNFSDSADFIGWYASKGYFQGFEKQDARSLYLAYHEGYTGFRNKTYRKKQWLIQVADRVQAKSQIYQQQYWGCAEELKKKRFIIF